MDDGSIIGGNMVEPELFWFVINGEVINWSVKGSFSVGKVPVKELEVGVSDELWFVIPSSKDILLKSGKVVSKWEAAVKGGDQVRIVIAKFDMWFGSKIG